MPGYARSRIRHSLEFIGSILIGAAGILLVNLVNQHPSLAQSSSAATPRFEVASIRPAAPTANVTTTASDGRGGNAPAPPPPPGGSGCIGRSTIDASRFNRSCVSLRALLLDAFGVLPSRLLAPDWTDTQRFDVSAKLPEGASQEQLPGMLQSLLEERFRLTFHRAYKEGSLNALVVAKGGLRVKLAASASAQPTWVSAAMAVNGPYGAGNIGGIRFRSIVVPSSNGAPTSVWQSPRMGFVRRSNKGGPGGITRYEAPNITFEGLADLAVIAGNGLDPGVVDMTGLKGRYQVDLAVSMADLIALLSGPGPKDASTVRDAQLSMVQEGLKKLGLQLEARKAPVETIVIDHLEKTPTEN
jgi:uncharacterized protein (TIGR03435 family)